MSAFPGAATGGAPALCLDGLDYARRVFGTDEASWFETPVLLATCRPMMQSLRADWLLFPLREWVQAWWGAHGPVEAGGSKPLRLLKNRLAHEALRSALLDALLALHSVTGSGAGLALQVDGPEQWLAWVGDESDDIDEGDAEDIVVYLAALVHALSGSGVSAAVVCQWSETQADASERYAALNNAAAHHGWARVLGVTHAPVTPDGFDALAAREPAPGQGLWLTRDDWDSAVAPATPFIVARIPAQATPEQVLAHIARWRGNH